MPPVSPVQWILNILSGVSEAERVLFRDPDPNTGFVLLPDMKWTGLQVGARWRGGQDYRWRPVEGWTGLQVGAGGGGGQDYRWVPVEG